MQSRGSSNRLSGLVFRSRISALMLSMFAAMGSIYVAGRLWQDAENRVYLIKELDRITGQEQSAISVDDTLKIIACREEQKKLLALEMELDAARQEGFVSKHMSETKEMKKRLLAVIGIVTSFGRKNNRDAIRKAWMPTGAALKKLEVDKGIIVRFVIGRSPNHRDSLDGVIDNENRLTNDFVVLDNHVETPKELPKKTKLFFVHAADTWDAEFYAKVNDDVYVNIDALGAMLATHLDKPRVYIGCMKSGEIFSEALHPSSIFTNLLLLGFSGITNGMKRSGGNLVMENREYFRHASGEMYVISRALAQFISINRSNLRTYDHDDVSVGSWFIGLNVKHVDESKFCCSSRSSGLSLSLSEKHAHRKIAIKLGLYANLYDSRTEKRKCEPNDYIAVKGIILQL
ncbi:hypothetical protein HHK36_029094 [Tetracentron sinense]|uniref:Hexosyltransferase n=1 Tax=Tetracentron sinense TaxID=13715 RepID=A0A834YIK1_TETSI|nr:hypothetical protein HHK36_029094 [Tetracentron sinense]